MSIENPSKPGIARLSHLLISLIAIVIILVYSKEYAITFIIALIVWFIIHELRENLQMVGYVKKHFPIWLQSTLAFIFINAVIIILMELLFVSMSDLTASLDLYEENFEKTLQDLSSTLGMDLVTQIHGYTETFDLSEFASGTFDLAILLLGDAFLIPIYVLFLLIEESIFHHKLAVIVPEKKQKSMTKLFHKMDKNIGRYLLLKTYVSLLTGLLSYFVMLAFGLDGAIFWALLIFVLNYVPTIGSLIATLFPAIFAILQFGEIAPFLYILATVGVIQVAVGNVLEPKIMGSSLNMSGLVVVLSLTIWGAIWGIMGMILSVPITVMMIIVFEEIPELRFIAVMLSERGDLNIED